MAVSIAVAGILVSTAGYAQPADIRVYSGGAPQQVLRILAPEFEKRTGHRVMFTFALVTEIQRRLGAGETADLILLPVALLGVTEKTVPLRPDSRRVLTRVGIGVIVREGESPPDISTAEAVRKMLLTVRTIALPDATVPSGSHLTGVMTELGIADVVKPKLVFKAAIDGGAELVAKREADVGLYLISEVHATKGVSVVGLLPAPFQNFIVYAAGVPVHSSAPDAALAFLEFVSDAAQAARWKAAGFDLGSEKK